MDRMKTFLAYVLLIIGFFGLSIILENGLLMAMYSPISGEFDGSYLPTNSKFEIDKLQAKACNVNGYMSFDLLNTTERFIDKCYVKIDLLNEQDLLADTEYIEVRGLQVRRYKTIQHKI